MLAELGIAYFLLFVTGIFAMSQAVDSGDSERGYSSKTSSLSGKITIGLLIAIVITGILAIFGSLLPWLPFEIHLAIFVIFALLLLVLPYWIVVDSIFSRRKK